MNPSAPSHATGPTPRRSAEPSALPTIAVLAVAVFVTACGKSTPESTTTAPASAAAPAVSETRIESEIANALSGTAPAPLPLSAGELEREAETILDKYPAKNAADLLNVPEVTPRLRILLGKLAQDKELQARINSSVDLAAQIAGFEGSAKLDLDMKGYNRARSSRMLQAALSEDPKQLVAFLVGEIGEATPDISYGGAQRAPNGVSLVPNPSAATPAVPPGTGQD